MELPANFLPKNKFSKLEPKPKKFDWFRFLPGGAQLEQRHHAALNSAISRLCNICAKPPIPPAIHRHALPTPLPSVELTWLSDFINAVDDLKLLDARTMGPMFAPKDRCNEVFQCLKKVILYLDSSDIVIECACSMLVLLLPPPSQTQIACDTDWKPFYLLFKQSIYFDNNFRTGIDCPPSTSTAFADCIQSIAYYFLPESGTLARFPPLTM